MTPYLNKQIIFLTFIALLFLQSCKSNIDGNSSYTDADSLLRYKSNHQLVTGTVVEYFSASHKRISSCVEYKNGYIDGKEEYYTNTGEMFLNGRTFRNIPSELKEALQTSEIKLWYEGSEQYSTCEFNLERNYSKLGVPVNTKINKAISFINNHYNAQIDFLYIHYKDTLVKYPIKLSE